MQRGLYGALAALALVVDPGFASAESTLVVPGQGDSIDEDATPVVMATRPRTDLVWVDVDPALVLPAVNTNKIYLNNCKPNGCVVRGGTSATSIDNATSQGGWPLNGSRTLTAFNQSDVVWNDVVACMRDIFSPFGVEITTTNPSPSNHFEIMIAGSPTDLGFSSFTGGISPWSCGEYIPNSLVFAFQKVYGSNVNEICATAAQEVAHSWRLDHVTDASDPMTYFSYAGRRRFKNAQVNCGSDCVNGTSPSGISCTGTNQQTRACGCTGSPTQNSFARIQSLFGAGTPTPPTVSILAPKLGDIVVPGFPVAVEATDDNGLSRVELYVDGMLTSQLASSPYAFNAPSTLTDGTHTVKVIAIDIYGANKEASVQVVIGKKCGKPADCPKDTDTCIGGRCVPGPGVQGGLGSTCNSGSDCASGECAQDSENNRYCVELCSIGQSQCPDGFGCLQSNPNDAANGICWPGYSGEDTGGVCAAGGRGGAMTLGLAALGLVIGGRRRRRR